MAHVRIPDILGALFWILGSGLRTWGTESPLRQGEPLNISRRRG